MSTTKSGEKNSIYKKTFELAFVFTLIFQLIFDGFNLNWLIILKLFAFYILILISYRWGEKGSDKDWHEFIKEEKHHIFF